MSRVFFPTIGMLFVFLAACSAPAMPISPTSTSDADSTVTIQLNPQVTSPALAPPLPTQVVTPTTAPTATRIPSPTPLPLSPLTIQYLRERTFPGSELKIEQTLTPGANYSRYIASYLSEGFKIYGLLTVPKGTKPATGWPVIIFNHGFIPPTVYRTTERYVAYVDAIARSGYIVFKSDYRGHGSSEGDATGGYGSPAYTIDVLNALASVKRMPEADPNRIGMWGHSMGGQVTLRAMVTDPEIKAGVIWAGVVGSYTNL
ncbi:MAG TPA: alpha/beta fold hydrolase, partial [Anaerolineae bacterium]|nr:alpha/beta fold hydrolase [Anaerolineae bacterium]